MTLPVKQKTWTILANQRITYVSLVQVQRDYMFGMKAFLLAHGYVTKGSCDGTTGAMDGADRWVTAANAGVRGATTGTANSWWCGTDLNGCNILLSFVGATDDVARFSFSPGGLYVAAGTPNQTPTATDEQVICSATSTIGTNTSLDRIWSGWVDSTGKLCRFAMFRNSVMIGLAWGVELIASVVSGVTFTPAVWGFCYSVAGYTANNVAGAYSANVCGGLARLNATNGQFGGSLEIFNNAPATLGTVQASAQGGVGYYLRPLGVAGVTASADGKIGNRYDWWMGRTSGTADGDVYGANEFIQFGTFVWPWDGSAPVIV